MAEEVVVQKAATSTRVPATPAHGRGRPIRGGLTNLSRTSTCLAPAAGARGRKRQCLGSVAGGELGRGGAQASALLVRSLEYSYRKRMGQVPFYWVVWLQGAHGASSNSAVRPSS
mmetsp:Transcript_92304/g.214470  ORF Transcript_92304/g.214470 Transcript_92304/m.214470 type:complete len:115 (+) Transcript_92304:51-395(+)